MIKIGFCNLKGGVGKTTACQNIAVCLAKMERKVAVVDMDPQSNLSAGFGVMPSSTEPQVFDLLSGAASWDEILRTKEGVDVIPSSLDLVLAELNEEGPLSRATALRDALGKIEQDRYDYVLLDSPPQLGIFTRNVLAACDDIIVPMDGGFYSLFGLRLLDKSMHIFHERLNPNLRISGILMTNYNPRLYITRKIFDEVRKTFGDVLFDNCIRQNVSLVEATSMGMSIFAYAPKSRGAEGYSAVTREFLKKFESGKRPVTISEAHETESETEAEQEHEQEPETVTVIAEEAGTETPELVITEQELEAAPPAVEPEPTPAPAPKPAPKPVIMPEEKRIVLGAYEESIKQDILDMLPDKEKSMWRHMFGSVSEITRDEIDVKALREDFENSDKDRYTFYILNDEEDSLWPIMYSDQIVEPLRCVVKWDENGTAEVYM